MSTAGSTAGSPTTAASRSGAAAQLIDAVAELPIPLMVLSGLDLCALDGTRHVLFDEAVARTWYDWDQRTREHVRREVIDSLAARDLLLRDPVLDERAPHDRDVFAMAPELGVVLHAKTRPGFAVLAHIEGLSARPLRMYSFGDQTRPLQAVVVEIPRPGPPGPWPHTDKLNALGWLYQYVLVAPAAAAELLAQWAIEQDRDSAVRVVSVLTHRPGRDLRDLTVLARGDGRTARLAQCWREGTHPDWTGPHSYPDLTQVMSELLAAASR
jgi:hypothetical protein